MKSKEAKGKKWDWFGYSSAFKDGKLYVPNTSYYSQAAEEIVVINPDIRCWYVTREGKQRGLLAKKVGLTKIVNFAKSDKWKGETNHYREWCETVGWDKVNLAMKFSGVQEKNMWVWPFWMGDRDSLRMDILQKLVVVDGFEELARRWPFAAVMSCGLSPSQLRMLLKKNDKEFIFYASRMTRTTRKRLKDAENDSWADHCKKATKSQVKIMKRIPGYVVTRKEAHALYRSITNCTDKRLSHMKRITVPLVAAMNDLKRHEIKHTTSLLEDIGRKGALRNKTGNLRLQDLEHILYDADNMLQILERNGFKFSYPPIKNIQGLKDLHDDVMDEYNDKIRYPDLEFPKPPFEGSKYIVPITTSKDLYREGRKMHHCVGSYAHYISQGGRYIYHVSFHDEEATLELRDNGAGSDWDEPGWQIGQLYGMCNKSASQVLRREVKEWLEQGKERKKKGLVEKAKTWPASLGDLLADKLAAIAAEWEEEDNNRNWEEEVPF